MMVNGKAVSADVAPRTHLADFLREELLLTGTHLGCEHGICGACTLLIDDAPARSCIAFAAVCEGTHVRTIEGLEHDPIIERLRAAFTAEHGLQCGYCTPGMLVTARDIVLRLPGADEDRIRLELAGNLCRCTGYAGIVRAIQSVLGETPSPQPQPQPAALIRSAAQAPARWEGVANPATPPPLPLRERARVRGRALTDQSMTEIVRLNLPQAMVWSALRDPALVASCVPGARLTSIDAGQLAGELTTSLGPIRAQFSGTARVTYNDDHTGTLDGEGQDAISRTHLHGTATFALRETSPASSELILTITYALRGPLAQLGRGPVVRAFAAELAEIVARTLEARLHGAEPSVPQRLGVLSLLWHALRRWLRGR
jgi:carbon-monoxide dehydrogenase small subunit